MDQGIQSYGWERHLLTSLQNLRSSTVFCDVSLLCKDGVVLDSHSLLLAAASDYFLRAFTRLNVSHAFFKVRVPFEASILKEVLNFVYTGRIESQDKEALLRIAKYLNVQCLKEALEGVDVCKNVGVQVSVKCKDQGCQAEDEVARSEQATLVQKNVYSVDSIEDNCLNLHTEKRWVTAAQFYPPTSTVSKLLNKSEKIEVWDVTLDEMLTAATSLQSSMVDLPQHINPSLLEAHKPKKKRRRSSNKSDILPDTSSLPTVSTPPVPPTQPSPAKRKAPWSPGEELQKKPKLPKSNLEKLRLSFQKKLGWHVYHNKRKPLGKSKPVRRKTPSHVVPDSSLEETTIIIDNSSCVTSGESDGGLSSTSNVSSGDLSEPLQEDITAYNVSETSVVQSRLEEAEKESTLSTVGHSASEISVMKQSSHESTVSQPVQKSPVPLVVSTVESVVQPMETNTMAQVVPEKGGPSPHGVVSSSGLESPGYDVGCKSSICESNNNTHDETSFSVKCSTSERESLLALYELSDTEDELTDKENDPASPVSERDKNFCDSPLEDDLKSETDSPNVMRVLGTLEMMPDSTCSTSHDDHKISLPKSITELTDTDVSPAKCPSKIVKRSRSLHEVRDPPKPQHKQRRRSLSSRHSDVTFVGENILHAWIDEDGSIMWYRGRVLRVTEGNDGDPGAEYEVKYEDIEIDDSYGEYTNYVDHLLEDYQDEYLVFL